MTRRGSGGWPSASPSIALPEQTITTRIWAAGEREGRDRYAYETTYDAGAVVIKDGWAEIG